MLLHVDPALADVGGLSRDQLDRLAASIELRRQQLERDISAYIRQRQEDLRRYEQELLAQHRSVECPGSDAAPLAEEKAKVRTKHTRVQKREKELYGLVTPVFLPLLDARDHGGFQEKQKAQQQTATPPATATAPEHDHDGHGGHDGHGHIGHIDDNDDNGESDASPQQHQDSGNSAKKSRRDMDSATPACAPPASDTPKKKRTCSAPSTTKKSALRTYSASKPRRKRVSLVIDGQTVLPADTVLDPPLASPGSEATSISNSTASLDDLIDPQLTTSPTLASSHTHTETLPVAPTLPTPISSLSTTTVHSPTKVPIPNLNAAMHATLAKNNNNNNNNHNDFNSSNKMMPSPPLDAILVPSEHQDADSQFSTYVGGLRGSGADNVDQAGSYGYPSSLGASYLESYMQSRPLRVRMEAVEKAGLQDEQELLLLGGGETDMDEDGMGGVGVGVHVGVGTRKSVEISRGHGGGEENQTAGEEDDDGDDFMGEMDDF
ncbi:hypothetical protein ACEQ8H_007544 [Pleosporales sp. CAS-2024a]